MPRRQDPRLNRAIQKIVEQVDARQTYAQQLEQVAGDAMGYGLRKAATWGAYRPAPSLREKIERAVADFTASYQMAINRHHHATWPSTVLTAWCHQP